MDFGGYEIGNDILRSQSFAHSLANGYLLPRWLSDLNAGCGSPAFFLNGPFPFYLTSLFSWLPGESSCVIAAFILVHSLSGIAFYALARNRCLPRESALAAALYLLMPYSWINMYARSAYAEFFSFLFIPLLLQLAHRIFTGDKKAIFLFALSYALFILSGLQMAVIGSLLIFFYFTHLIWKERSSASLHNMAFASALGIALSAIYLLPFAESFPFVRLSNLDLNDLGFFKYADHLVISSSHFDNNLFATLFITTCFIIFARKTAFFLRKLIFSDSSCLFWLFILGFGFFLMSALSAFLLYLFPPLELLYFPLRFAMFISIALPMLVANILFYKTRYPSAARKFETILYPNYSLLYLIALFVMIQGPLPRSNYSEYMEHRLEGWPGEYLPIAASTHWLWPDQEKKKETAEDCEMKGVWPGSAKIKSLLIEKWTPRALQFSLNVTKGGTIDVGQFNFPYWQAHDEKSNSYSVDTSPEGLIALTLPAGYHKIFIEMPEWELEYIGRMISTAAAFILLLGWVWAFFWQDDRKFPVVKTDPLVTPVSDK